MTLSPPPPWLSLVGIYCRLFHPIVIGRMNSSERNKWNKKHSEIDSLWERLANKNEKFDQKKNWNNEAVTNHYCKIINFLVKYLLNTYNIFIRRLEIMITNKIHVTGYNNKRKCSQNARGRQIIDSEHGFKYFLLPKAKKFTRKFWVVFFREFLFLFFFY